MSKRIALSVWACVWLLPAFYHGITIGNSIVLLALGAYWYEGNSLEEKP